MASAERRHRSAWLVFAAATAAVVILIGWVRRGGPERGASEPGGRPLVLLGDSRRGIEGRISYAAADAYRPYRVAWAGAAAGLGEGSARSAAEPGDKIELATLAELERRRDFHGVAAALLLTGEMTRATEYLDRAAPGPDVLADRALVQAIAGQRSEALVALDRVLEAAPRHPQALWNRALVLRDMGLSLAAAGDFEAVAALHEPGWSDEARARARALSDEMAERQAAFERLTFSDGPRLATAPDAVTPEIARRFPGMARLLFYDAVRGAEAAELVQRLAPLAAALDAVYGGHVLAAYVERIARSDFGRRAPLARRYAALVAGQPLDAAGARDLVAALRIAGQADVLFGAIVRTHPGDVPSEQIAELRGLAASAGDPWFELLAAELEAKHLVATGRYLAAETVLLPALASCQGRAIDYRCGSVDLALGESYLFTLRLPDARRVLAAGWVHALRGGEWFLEQRFLPMMAQLEQAQDDVVGSTLPLVRAYTREMVLRNPSRCDRAAWAAELVALMYVNRADLEHARAELARASAVERSCPAFQPDISGVFARAHVLRDPRGGSLEEVAALRAQIAAVRTEFAVEPGLVALSDHAEGRLLIDRDRAAGTALLERAIAVARGARPEDVDASKARAFSYAVLTLDAARAEDWRRVWKLLGDEAGFTPGTRCTLGATVEDRAGAVVLRDAAGAEHGVFDPSLSGPAIDGSSLVPASIRGSLGGCVAIDVVARPLVQGLPALLPVDVAWSYRLGARRDAGAGVARHRRVVISGAEPPAALGLPRLAPWAGAAPEVSLSGRSATPSRALAELQDATFVEIHAHGMVRAVESDASLIMLSPEPDGQYTLTAGAIRSRPLRGHPVVVLAACHAAATATFRHETWSLPAAFIAAGARAVIASTGVISDADAGAFFDELRARIERGQAPAIALRDVRLAWLAVHPDAAWLRSLMVFE